LAFSALVIRTEIHETSRFVSFNHTVTGEILASAISPLGSRQTFCGLIEASISQ
jgi:hypothetical protein